MARTSARLPKRFPTGTTYVVEARGSVRGMTLMHRYVRFPDGRRIDLAARLVQVCEKSGVTPQSGPRQPAGSTEPPVPEG